MAQVGLFIDFTPLVWLFIVVLLGMFGTALSILAVIRQKAKTPRVREGYWISAIAIMISIASLAICLRTSTDHRYVGLLAFFGIVVSIGAIIIGMRTKSL